MDDLTPPSAVTEAECAERWLEDGCLEEPRCCLAVDDELGMGHPQHQRPVERIGVLMRWWRIVRRSFALAGLWRALEKKRSRTKKKCRKSLKDMYNAKMEEIKGEGQVRVYGYDQVVKYVQIGEFLAQYPQFVMQTLRTRLSDWLKPLKKSEGPRKPFIDIIKELLGSDEDANKKKTKRTCCCSNDEDVVKCSECECLFHEHCAGYEKVSTWSRVGNQPRFFVESVYCPDCLDEKHLTVKDVEDALREQHGLAEYLNREDCPFVFEHVDRDGFCLFRNLVDFAKEQEEEDALCRKILDAAVDATEAAQTMPLTKML